MIFGKAHLDHHSFVCMGFFFNFFNVFLLLTDATVMDGECAPFAIEIFATVVGSSSASSNFFDDTGCK
jgi:hypothetical protein